MHTYFIERYKQHNHTTRVACNIAKTTYGCLPSRQRLESDDDDDDDDETTYGCLPSRQESRAYECLPPRQRLESDDDDDETTYGCLPSRQRSRVYECLPPRQRLQSDDLRMFTITSEVASLRVFTTAPEARSMCDSTVYLAATV